MFTAARELLRLGRAPIQRVPVRGNKLLANIVEKSNAKDITRKLRVISRNYMGYIKWTGGIGGVLGGTFAGAHMLDIADDRKLSRKEMVAYPIAGTIGGGFLGVTSPVWIMFAPIGYVLGYDTTAALAKVVLSGILLSDDGESGQT